MPIWTSMSFQDTLSPIMEQVLFFHDHAMIILTLITVMTIYTLMSLTLSKKFNKFIMEGQEIETIWTILPAFMLIFIAFPSLKTLYLMEDTKSPEVTVKTIGHQWYWSYEYSSLNSMEMDSFMEESKTLRLLKTSDTLQLPTKVTIRSLISSSDVIHSWALPSMGIKVDAFPGRLNQTFLFSKRLGVYSGQCSEICGMNHSFMPILIHFSTPQKFINMIKNI